MDKHTKNLKNMIRRMIEIDTPPKATRKKLDEMASMNVSMSGETAEEVASLMKILQNAGVSEPEAPGAETMPMRQDMERLAGIMGDPEPALPASGSEQESLEEWSSSDADTLALLHSEVQSAAKGDRRAAAQFEDYIDNNFPNVDSEELIAKLVKMDDNQQFEVLHDVIASEYRNDDNTDYTDQSMRKGEIGEAAGRGWSREDASELEVLHKKAMDAAKGDRRAGSQLKDYINNNFVGVDGERFLMKLKRLDKNKQISVLHDLIRDGERPDNVNSADDPIRKGGIDLEGYGNEPDEEYQDAEYMTKDLSGGLNRQKKSYVDAEDGDNPMAVESIKERLYARLSEKKAKPDYANIDGDGDKKEPMKKAAKDKKKK